MTCMYIEICTKNRSVIEGNIEKYPELTNQHIQLAMEAQRYNPTAEKCCTCNI